MIINGTNLATRIRSDIKEVVGKIKDSRIPCLAVCIVGKDPASQTYVNAKIKASTEVGIKSVKIELPDNTTQGALIQKITQLNQDKEIDGILVQLPLPKHIDAGIIKETISPKKDVDGLNPLNFGKLLQGRMDGLIPCTPLAVMKLLEEYKIEVGSKNVLIIGRSDIVGKPLAILMMHKNATVTIAHSFTRDISELCGKADIIVAGIGKPNFVRGDMVKDGVIVIDVGINRVEDPKSKTGYLIVGDVNFEEVSKKASYITPVPGGVGPMTIAMLLRNTLLAFTNP